SWYAALSTVHVSLESTPAAKHCDGTPILPTDVPMVRITGTTFFTATTIPAAPGTTPIDWNGDLNTSNDFGLPQDVSFDGAIHTGSDPAPAPPRANDRANIAIGLQQLGSRRNIEGLSLGVGRTDSGRTDSGRTDSGRTDSGRTDSGRTDSGNDQDAELAG